MNNTTEGKSSSLSREERGGSGKKSPLTGRFRGSAWMTIGDYIVDFLFRKSKVIVEIDGGYHFTEKQQTDDAVRTDWLEQQGYKVIRFTNEQVLFETDKVIEELKKSLDPLSPPV